VEPINPDQEVLFPVVDSDPLRVLREARALLDEGNGWTKGEYRIDDSDGQRWCLIGAAAQAVDEYLPYEITTHLMQTDWPGLNPALFAITEVIREQYPEFSICETCGAGCTDPLHLIPGFNDLDDTTWEQVDRVLDKAEVVLTERANL